MTSAQKLIRTAVGVALFGLLVAALFVVTNILRPKQDVVWVTINRCVSNGSGSVELDETTCVGGNDVQLRLIGKSGTTKSEMTIAESSSPLSRLLETNVVRWCFGMPTVSSNAPDEANGTGSYDLGKGEVTILAPIGQKIHLAAGDRVDIAKCVNQSTGEVGELYFIRDR